MAAAQWCNRTTHRATDRPLHHDCRRQRQMSVTGARSLNPSPGSREMLHDAAISLATTRKAASIAFFALVLSSCGLAWAGSAGTSTTPVRVWEDSITIPTSEEGLPDPNPPFDFFNPGRFLNYPYTLRHNLVDRRIPRTWRTLNLENEYLKCTVLPDLGGHLYTCIDKITGVSMFYANPSIKFARIAYRGMWAALGVEFNFPVSHNWMTVSPVDFSTSREPDGGASVWVGNIDRPYGMQWRVQLTLRPGQACLEQKTTLYNRSDTRHRFYWWTNAGVQVGEDSRILYPMELTAAHGFADIDTWPVNSAGVDQSIVGNHKYGPVSRFSYGSREPYMAVYHPHTDSGIVHYSSPLDLPAKKIWSWGVDADGLDWRTALSDNNSAYVEIQAGLFRNQETYAFLEPRQTLRFTEYWMPVRETGGISRANLVGVVHLERKGGVLHVALNTNRKILSASVRIVDGSTSLLVEREDLTPEQVWKKQLRLPDASRKYRFELRDKEGTVLLTQSEGEYDWVPDSEIEVGPQRSYDIPQEAERTADDWLQFGMAAELNGELLIAAKGYQKALGKFPASFELLKASGRLLASLERYQEAADHLAAAHARNTIDSETSYYLAVSYEALGQDRNAIDAYQEAMRLPAYRAAAALRLGELSARQGAMQDAENFLSLGLYSAPEDLRMAEELAAVMRARGKVESANKLVGEWLARFPQSAFLSEEIGKARLEHLAADPYRVLDVASEYARLGFYRRAVEILSRKYPPVNPDQSEPGTVLPQNHPLVVYFRGYCREKLGQSGAEDDAAASRLSTTYVFPNSEEDFASLKAALRQNENDASAHFLLGTWYFARGETDIALEVWRRAKANHPSLPVLDANIGLALLHVKGKYDVALQAFEEGIKNDPRNATNYSGAIAAATLLKKPPTERVKILERYPDLSSMPTALVEELALSRAEAGNYPGAVELFKNRFFGREEGGTNVRQVWIEVKLAEALHLGR